MKKEEIIEVFGVNVEENELPINFLLSEKKMRKKGKIVKVIQCDEYNAKRVPVSSFYKPITIHNF